MKKLIILIIVFGALVVPGMRVQSEPVAAGAPAATGASAAAGARHVEVTAKRYAFDPAVVTLKKGETVVLVLKSADVPHGVRFRELGVEVKAPKGGTGQVQFTPDKTGDFVGHCFVFCGEGHGTMALTLHVVG
jgi:cytochrome c oxidase subunit 2